jgi:glycosyltransferase involved in cell wall biosynthesis
LKIIGFFNSLNFWGGGEKLHLEYALEFRKLGYRVLLFTNENSPLAKKAKQENLEIIHVKINKSSFLNPFKIASVCNLFRENGIDTVIFSSSQDMKVATISAHRASVKSVVYLRGLAVPIKASFINSYIIRNYITHFVPNSIETERLIFRNIPGKFNSKVIYHGIETSLRKEVDEKYINMLRNSGNGIILGNAGRLTPQKGQDFLLDVALELKKLNLEFTLFIAGSGELESDLKNRIKRLNLTEHVKLLGFVSDMNSFMASIDVFLLSSLWEGFGYVLVEAMNHSKPIVAFNISSNPEIVINHETGFLVKPNHVQDFTQSVKYLIENHSLRKQMGNKARLDVANRFELKDRIKEFEAFLLK